MRALTDRFGRTHDYLRISLTDKCNLRCSYCMPENATFRPHTELMTGEEIYKIAQTFVNEFGIKKIRLTGGEPLLRKDFREILFSLARLNSELLLTTNGSFIHRHLHALKDAGVSSVNVSLDSLKPSVFQQITKRNQLYHVWENILLLLDNGFRVKINTVAMRGTIEEELIDFIQLTKKLPLHVRFIEFMPFPGNKWHNLKVITADEMLQIAQEQFDIVKLKDEPHATAKKYKVIGHEGTFAFITTMSRQFCGECNRLRLTAEGKLKNCLFGKMEIDLLTALRKGDDILPLILSSLKGKHAAMGGQFEKGYAHADAAKLVNRSMVTIGG